MEERTKGVLLGVAGIVLWFAPMTQWDGNFMGEMTTLHQAGHHIGGVAYLLLLASAAYAVLSWFELHSLRAIAAGVAIGVCLLFMAQAGSRLAWGLVTLFVVSGLGFLFALAADKRSRRSEQSASA